jgi:hypothetical protein
MTRFLSTGCRRGAELPRQNARGVAESCLALRRGWRTVPLGDVYVRWQRCHHRCIPLVRAAHHYRRGLGRVGYCKVDQQHGFYAGHSIPCALKRGEKKWLNFPAPISLCSSRTCVVTIIDFHICIFEYMKAQNSLCSGRLDLLTWHVDRAWLRGAVYGRP